MNLIEGGTTQQQNIAISTAFRLPTVMLEAVDRWCCTHDVTRSQFFRHCINDRIKSLGLDRA
jgi:hypothetical protein